MNILSLTVGPLQTNCYVLYGGGGRATVIDPGGSSSSILHVLRERCLTLDKILLTHAHFDHIMAIEPLRSSGAELYLHADDLKMLNDPTLNCMLDFAGREEYFATPEHLLSDGDTIETDGGVLKVLHTPGHTKGSVCYVGDGVIFTGDTLFRESAGRTDLYGGSFEMLLASLKKLSGLTGEYRLLCGHGPDSTLTYEKNNNIYMKTLR